MSPALTFFAGVGLLVLFGWYFATDVGLRNRVLATTLVMLLVAFSIATIWPPKEKIQLGLDIQGGTSFLIRLMGGDKEVNKGMLDQAVEVIRKRIDYFGVSEPVISPVGNDRILVQIPGLDTAKIQEAREQLSRVAKLEFRLVYPDNGERLRTIDEGKEVIPPEYRIEVYKMAAEENEARGLASVLENPLQTPVSIEEERSVSPTLGMDSIRSSVMAGLLGLAITLVCVLIYYRLPGLVANLALLVNLVLLIGALTMFRFVLTLPGIAGIILTICLSVDANVLIYERLREEMALWKSLRVAMETVSQKAFSH